VLFLEDNILTYATASSKYFIIYQSQSLPIRRYTTCVSGRVYVAVNVRNLTFREISIIKTPHGCLSKYKYMT